MTRSAEEIQAEISALEKLKARVPRLSAVGINNHWGIDLQIEVLRYGIDTTAEEFCELDGAQREVIRDAEKWRTGESNKSPSSDWDHFKTKRKARKAKRA